MNAAPWIALTVLSALACLAGCARQNIRVRCDAHLQPINPPALALQNRTADALASKPGTVAPSGGRP